VRALAVPVLIAAVLATTAGAAPKRPAALHLELVADGLASPTYVASAPGEPNNLYVVEQPGTIRVLAGGHLRATPFLDLRSRVRSGGERGLLSVAFDPGYRRNRLFYVDYTDRNGDTRVVRFRARSGRAVLSSAKQLLFVRQPYPNHNGGQLQLGPDRQLYVGMGDGGSAGDPENRAQNLSSRLGKLLRTSVTARRPAWRAAAYGLRNPWRFSFDRATGDLYVGDVGQNEWEEVDYRTRAQLERRWNFGWARYEGNHSFKSGPFSGASPYVAPVAEYQHTGGSCSITGGYVYRGQAIPSYRGRYLYGDYCSGVVWSLRISSGRAVDVRQEPISVPQLSSFGQDGAGELYAVSQTGRVFKLAG
jgi:glucose/arabinose dehydrogenase